jgi:ribonuclease P protein component
MLAVERRLRRSGDFTAAVRAGRRAGRGGLVVHLLLRSPGAGPTSADPMTSDRPGTPARAGFVVSRAVGNAVTRNRVRRRLRHLVRPHLQQLPAGADLVVRVLPAAAAQSYDQLGTDLAAAVAAACSARTAGRRAGRSPGGGGRDG